MQPKVAAAVEQSRASGVLDCTASHMSDAALSQLTEALRAAPASVVRVLFERNDLKDGATLAAFTYVVPQVEELILSRNRLSGVNVSLLAAALVRRPQLTVLDLSRNELDSEATSALCSALAEAKALSVLRLRDNNIGADGAMAVAKMLMVGSLPLKELDLGHNLVQDAGAVAIAGAIGSDMSQLERLNLDFNNISATGAEALAKAMTQSPALRHLSVVDNQLGDEGTSLLETALENSKVEELYLRGNSSASAGTSI